MFYVFVNYNHTVPIHKLLLMCNQKPLQCISIFFCPNVVQFNYLSRFRAYFRIFLYILAASGARTTRFPSDVSKNVRLVLPFALVSFRLEPSVVLLVCRLTQLRQTLLRTQQKLVEIPKA